MSAQREQVLDLDFSWLHDDAEEDLVGADWHQDAIRDLSLPLKALAVERGWPWHVGDQLTLIGEKPDGKLWRPAPDVSIHPTLGPRKRENLDVRVEGPPALVIEVASRSTWTYDVSLERTFGRTRKAGKAYGYLYLLRVPEYLVFDPAEDFIAGQVRAWRWVGQALQAWTPEPDGRYLSRELGLAFRPEADLLRAYDPQGQPVPFWFENIEAIRRARALEQELIHRDRELTTRDQELARRDQQIAELRAELERLQRRPPG